MATTTIHQSKPQWRFERPHRVRLFAESVSVTDTISRHQNDIYWAMAKKFAETDRYKWAESNNIKLEWTYDDQAINWNRLCMFYADLTESQYIDYSLRFFNHHDEEWK